MWRIRYRLSGFVLIALLTTQNYGRLPAQGTFGPTLAAEGDHFTLNGVPTFLIMVSYYDALRMSPSGWTTDLNFFQQRNIKGVRIFPNWQHYSCLGSTSGADDSLIKSDGTLNNITLEEIKDFLEAASARNLIVDVTFGRDTLTDPGEPKIDGAKYRAGLQAATTALLPYRNVLFDVHNEWTRDGADTSEAEVKDWIAAVHARDPQRLVSGSTTKTDLHAGQFAGSPGIDFAAHHDERNPTTGTWYGLVGSVVQGVRNGMGANIKPIYLQEPMPFTTFCPGQTVDGDRAHHYTAVRNARTAGAAGWTFHSRTSFDLAGTNFVQRAGSAEELAISDLVSQANGACWGGNVVSLSPQGATLTGGVNTGSFSVTMNGACNTNWSVTSDAAWLTATPASGTGNATVTYTAAPNGQVARVGHLTIRGRTFTVSQAASQSVKITWQHRNSDGLLSVWFMNGLNKVGDALLTPSTVSDQQWHIVGTGDYNRDGQPDLFWQHQGTGELAVWRMGGVSGTEQILGESLEPSIVADLNWKVRTVADMDRDGYPDLIWQNIATGDLAVWWMNGRTRRAGDGGQPLIPGSVPPSTTWTIIAAGDVNRDGYPDLIWHKLDEGFVSVWFMQGRTQLSGQSVTPNGTSDLNWKLRGAGDLDRNGYPDLIWQNISTREVAAWLMTGLTQTSGDLLSGNPNPLPDTNWTVVAPK